MMQALVDDLLEHRLNRVTIDVSAKEGSRFNISESSLVMEMYAAKSKKKTYDLNTQSDPFFGKYASVPFPEAVEANEKELAEVAPTKTFTSALLIN